MSERRREGGSGTVGSEMREMERVRVRNGLAVDKRAWAGALKIIEFVSREKIAPKSILLASSVVIVGRSIQSYNKSGEVTEGIEVSFDEIVAGVTLMNDSQAAYEGGSGTVGSESCSPVELVQRIMAGAEA